MFQKPLSMSFGTAGGFFVIWLFEWVNTKYTKGGKLKKEERVSRLFPICNAEFLCFVASFQDKYKYFYIF